MADIAEFLRAHPPFDTVDAPTLDAIARSAESERHRAGATILDASKGPLDHGCVVRTGSVELTIEGRLLDLMGEGELFGFTSVLSEDPPDYVARAAQDSEIYRIPAGVLRPVLQRPAFVRFVTQVMNKRVRLLAGHDGHASTSFAGRPVAELIRGPALVCPPAMGVQEAARRMAELGATSAVVDMGEGFGIVTDRDIRERVVAAGADPDTPLADVMSAPAWTVSADRTGTEALLEMLAHGIRHLPVLAADRRLLGVLDDVDLLANERRAPFRLQNQIERASALEEVASAAAELPALVIDLFDAALPPLLISRAITSIQHAVTRRLIEFAEAELGRPPVPYTWLAMGSYGRYEPFPGSDVDCAIAWEGPDEDLELRRTMITLAERVLEGLDACGFPADSNSAVASNPLFARSVDEWERAATTWVEHPDAGSGLMLVSVVVESDPVWGVTDAAAHLASVFAQAPNRALMLRRLASAAVAVRPPTGFLRDFVLHSSGERKGVLDIKRGGMLPIDNLARWSGLRARVGAASTRARLKASSEAGTLTADDAGTLRDAFELFSSLRMEHQIAQLRRGEPADNLIAPRELTRVTRTALKEAFRAVARVQNRVATEVGLRI
jgi:CBS domain-containing protein